MWFIGKLSRDQRGVGSIIGATFIVLILLSGFTFYALNVNATESYNKTLETMSELDWNRNREKPVIKGISITSANKLNITVKNEGPIQIHLIWLGVFNQMTTPVTQQYFSLDQSIDPDETATNIGSDVLVTPGNQYLIQLVTERGNIVSQGYPITTVLPGESASITISGPAVILFNTWTTYTIKVTSASGSPLPYAYLSISGNGSSVKLRQPGGGGGGSNPLYANTDQNGEYNVEVRSSTNAGESFILYVVVGNLVAKKSIYQTPK